MIKTLPIRLQQKLKSDVYDDCLNQIKLFKEVEGNGNGQFVTWVSYRVTLNVIVPTTYVYEETDDALGIFFVRKESLAYVLSHAKNAVFHRVNENSLFGFEDFIYAAMIQNP